MSPRAEGWLPVLRAEARLLARNEAPLVTLVGLYVAAGWLLGVRVTLPSLLGGAAWSLLVLAALVGSYLIVFAFQTALAVRKRGAAERTGKEWSVLWRTELSASRLAGLFVALTALVPFMDTFVGFKAAIPRIQAFRWDPVWMELDRRLHFGHHPWELLQPLLGHAPVTNAVDSLYYLWFVVLGLTLVWQAWSRQPTLRAQFFVSYAGMWILLGTVAAAALSSAGPCYYGRVVGTPNPYAPLMEYLSSVNENHPLIALEVQDYLWRGYASGATRAVEGISAMPSLHVATPMLLALLGWRTHRWLGLAFTIYVLIVVLGSVHLGWHYAVDGYASIVAVPLIWKASGAAVSWYSRRVAGPAEDPAVLAGPSDTRRSSRS